MKMNMKKINKKMKTVIVAFMLLFNYLDTLPRLYPYIYIGHKQTVSKLSDMWRNDLIRFYEPELSYTFHDWQALTTCCSTMAIYGNLGSSILYGYLGSLGTYIMTHCQIALSSAPMGDMGNVHHQVKNTPCL